MVPADERGVSIGSGTSETERVAEDEPKLSGARGVADALVGDPSGELGSGWVGRDWLGKVGGCSLAVAGPSPPPMGSMMNRSLNDWMHPSWKVQVAAS